jgi:hypothetical protein
MQAGLLSTPSHSATLQCKRHTNHVILNFNKNMPMGTEFVDIKKALDTTWHLGLLYELSKLIFDQSNEAY